MNTTFQINEIITNLEKLIQFVETEKATILSSSKQGIYAKQQVNFRYHSRSIF